MIFLRGRQDSNCNGKLQGKSKPSEGWNNWNPLTFTWKLNRFFDLKIQYLDSFFLSIRTDYENDEVRQPCPRKIFHLGVSLPGDTLARAGKRHIKLYFRVFSGT